MWHGITVLRGDNFCHLPLFIMQQIPVEIEQSDKLTEAQLQSILAGQLSETVYTYQLYQQVARNWRMAEAEKVRLQEQLRDRQPLRKLIKRYSAVINWSINRSSNQTQSVPGLGLELVVGLLMVTGFASLLV